MLFVFKIKPNTRRHKLLVPKDGYFGKREAQDVGEMPASKRNFERNVYSPLTFTP